MLKNSKKPYEYLKEEIEKAIANRFGSQKELADLTGIAQGNLSDFLNGKRAGMNFETAYKILEVLGLDFESISKPTPTIKGMRAYLPIEQIQDNENLNSIHIHAVAGAGPAWEILESEPLTTIFVPRKYDLQADFAFLINGESMYPTIKNNAVVGINNISDFVQNEIYAIRTPYEGVAIKRISINYERKMYVIRSDNHDQTKYPPTEISIEENPNFLIGRVVWVWQSV